MAKQQVAQMYTSFSCTNAAIMAHSCRQTVYNRLLEYLELGTRIIESALINHNPIKSEGNM